MTRCRFVLPALAVVLGAASLAGCTQGPNGGYGGSNGTIGNNTTVGALLGAGAGALGGYFSSGNKDDRRKNALIGAGIGALAGGAVGNYMDRQEVALRQDLQGSGVKVQRQGDNILLTMPNQITFGFDQSNVQSAFYPVLDNVSGVLNQYPSTFIDIVGHTDSVGSDSYNMDLSQRRAQSVASYLIGKGVVAQRLVVRGVGEQFPVASNDTDAGRAQNRRVEILISPVREGM
ncbi:MAG: OmpA family protein [Pseudomonadaceae bacterium]|nr:OmpA family protein [Pseudomonadaceae bacterium]